MTRRLAAIMAADVVGYSRMMQTDEADVLSALKALRSEYIDPTISRHHGRIVKLMGDGALIEFASVVEAVKCAVEVQTALADRNRNLPADKRLELRIGINLGDVMIDDGDLYGNGVNIASRLEAQAPRGGLLISDAVYAQVMGKLDVRFSEAGDLALKNIAARVRAWSWNASTLPCRPQATPPITDFPSIAVLPFINLSGDPEQQYFADGLVEDLITTLSKLSDLRVIARNSTFVYQGEAVDVRDVARQLGVRYVLQGSVRRSANRIRVTTQLIDLNDGSHVWAERFDRSIEDIFAVQDEITLAIATEMQVTLTEGEQARLRYKTTGNVEAWTFWLQGLYHFNKAVTDENMAAALASWTKALALDPKSASLHAMVGFVHYLDARFGWWGDRLAAQQKAQTFADRALELDPEDADANVTSSLSKLLSGAYEEAAKLARRAIRSAPGSAHAATMACFVLAFAGHPVEAVSHGERAIALCPKYPGYFLGTVGNAYRLAGMNEKAISAFKAYHSKAPGFGLVDLVLVYEQSGRHEDAANTGKLLLELRPNFTIDGWAITQFQADADRLRTDVAALIAAGLPTVGVKPS